MRRYDCLALIAAEAGDALVLIPLGGTIDEWHALQTGRPTMYFRGMGIVTPAGLGLALARPNRRVIVLETDGSALFNLSALVTIGVKRPPNLCVFVMDNECYQSIGGIPTATAAGADLAAIAAAAGIPVTWTVRTLEDLGRVARDVLTTSGPAYVVCKIDARAADVPRKPHDGLEDKYAFVRQIEAMEGVSILAAPKDA